MGSLYAILSLVGLAFIGGAFLIFALEGGKEQRWFFAAFFATFGVAAYILWEVVHAILASE